MAVVEERVREIVQSQVESAIADLLGDFSTSISAESQPPLITERQHEAPKSKQGLSAVLETVKMHAAGVGMGDLITQLGCDRNEVKSWLRTLRSQGSIRMEGIKGKAKYFLI